MLGVGAKVLTGMVLPGLEVGHVLVLQIETITSAGVESGDAGESVLGFM